MNKYAGMGESDDRTWLRSPLRRGWHSAYRSCVSKVAYPSEQKAGAKARRAKHARDVELRVYACELCGRWHLTKRV